VCGIALILVLLLYAAVVVVFFGEYFTYENMRYFVRDWSTMTMPGSGVFTDIVYSASEDAEFALFKNGLALYDHEKYSYYDETGICLVEDETGCTDPAASVSEKYLLLYDIGGTGYSVYNQLTRIISRKTERPIIAADIADDGSMVIVSKSRETRFVAEVYNASFTKSMNIHKESFVLDAGISPDGKNVIICSVVPSDTDFNLEVEIVRTGSSDKTAAMTYEHTMPLDVMTHEEGFVLLCDNGIYFFDYDGHITSSVKFGGMALAYADMNETSVAAAGRINSLGNENRVIVCDISGNILGDTIIRERINGITASRNTDEALAYVRGSDTVLKLMPDGETELHAPEFGEIIGVVARERDVLICRAGGAYVWK
ncbi:MAG: hypothetical protein IKI93_09945, partial [Clostridia bacterium]|nr:hypothetical protein [Clostridia bacterium]